MPAWSEARASEIIRRHLAREGALLPILHDVQAAFACVPGEAVPFIADALNLTRAEACQSMNGEALARQVLDRFGLEWGQTTPDGRVTVEATYCLGLCACAPSAMLDGEPMARLTPQSVEEIARQVDR